MSKTNGARLFIHPPLNREVRAAAGRMEFLREGTVEAGGRKVQYLIGAIMADSTCCGEGGLGYALVSGALVEDRGVDYSGLRVSMVAPVFEEEERKKIDAAIREAEPVAQVIFWDGEPGPINSGGSCPRKSS